MATILQGADIRDVRAAVARRYLRGKIRHGAKAVGNHVVKVADGHLPQPVLVIGRRMAEAAVCNHAVAVALEAVARRAEDVVALSAALEKHARHRQRKFVRVLGNNQRVVDKRPSCHGVLDERPFGAEILEKVGRRQRLGLGLARHILRTATEDQEGRESSSKRKSTKTVLAPRATHRTPRSDRAPSNAPRTEKPARDRTSDRALRCTGRTGCSTPGRSAEH